MACRSRSRRSTEYCFIPVLSPRLNCSATRYNEISARGRLPADVCGANIAVIGSGALGSVIAEMLARAGVNKLVIIDKERIEMGNLVRHTLTMNNLGLLKAEAVRSRLGTVSPNIHVDAYSGAFPPQDADAQNRLGDCDLVIDTTGSDEVIEALAELTWPDSKLMVSVSLSIGAKHLYVFTAKEHTFPAADFHRWIDPQLRQDAAEWQDQGLPKEIEAAMIDPPDGHRSCVIAQGETERGFGGLEKP